MKKGLIMFGVVLVVGLIGLAVFVSAGMIHNDDFSYDVEVDIVKGWNIVAGIFPADDISSNSEIKSSDIRVVWYWNPELSKYMQVYPEFEGNVQAFNAMWVYSDKAGKLRYTTTGKYTSLSDRQLKKGYNFITITPDMIEKSLNDIKGTCTIEKAYVWWSEGQKWQDFGSSLNEKIPERSSYGYSVLGSGIVIKVSSNCRLGTSSSTTSPPSLPSEINNQCKDTDGSNIYVKGIVTDKYGSHTDSCVMEKYNDNTKQWEFNYVSSCTKTEDNKFSQANPSGNKERCVVNEFICMANNENGADNYYCSNGCSNGACISSTNTNDFPSNMGDFELKNLDLDDKTQCGEIEGGEICTQWSRIEYVNKKTNEAIHFLPGKISKGKQIYINYIKNHNSGENFEGISGVFRGEEPWELYWFTNTDYDLVGTQRYMYTYHSEGISTTLLNATTNNEVVKYFLNKYKPIQV